jgi:transcriptional regulator with XRE-family HTH domain
MGPRAVEDHGPVRDTLVAMDDLAATLRAWRDRLAPSEPGPRRRTPGLRRQEVAERAGLSVGYLTRLEQGRATHPSPLVLSALARALRLSADEQQHLFRLAGHAAPAVMSREITPGVQRMLDRLHDLPILIGDAAGDLITVNRLGAALFGDPRGNVVLRHFGGEPGRVSHDDEAVVEADMVADLHAAAARWPDDGRLREVIAEAMAYPRFAALWEQRPARVRTTMRKFVEHPEVGRLALDCDILHTHDSDLRIVVFSAAPGTPDAEALAHLGAGEFVF